MDNSENMLNELIKGIGMMTELWMITYQSFKNHKFSDEEAMNHTKAYMSIMLYEIMFSGRENGNDQN